MRKKIEVKIEAMGILNFLLWIAEIILGIRILSDVYYATYLEDSNSLVVNIVCLMLLLCVSWIISRIRKQDILIRRKELVRNRIK